jgi:tetratricopeptide (TPR) repeat protein
MKNSLLTLYLLMSLVSFGQTAIYSSNGVLTIETPVVKDVLLGYPTADVLDSRAIDNYNKGTEILQNLNKALNKTKEKDLIIQAIDYFIISINFDSKFVQAYDNIGKAYRMLKKYDLAIISYEMSLKIFPKGISAHQNLAIVYDKQKNWDKAIKEYKTLITISPKNPEGYYGLANIYKKTSKLKLALFNAFIALDLYRKEPTNYIGDSYGQIGLIYYYMGNKLKAKEYIQIAKEKHLSNNLESYFNSTFPDSMIKELSIN